MSYMRDLDGYRLDTFSIKERLDALEQGTELAYSENSTATPTTVAVFAAAATVIPYTMLRVPATSFPVEIGYGCSVTVTTAGTGAFGLELWDVTAGGTGTKLHQAGQPFVVTQTAVFSGNSVSVDTRKRLESSATERVLILKALLYRDGAPGLALKVDNHAAPLQPTYIQAVKL